MKMISFPNNICAAVVAYPNFMDTSSININPVANSKRVLHGLLVFWVGDGQLAFHDQVSREAAMGMRRVVGVSGGELVSLAG